MKDHEGSGGIGRIGRDRGGLGEIGKDHEGSGRIGRDQEGSGRIGKDREGSGRIVPRRRTHLAQTNSTGSCPPDARAFTAQVLSVFCKKKFAVLVMFATLPSSTQLWVLPC